MISFTKVAVTLLKVKVMTKIRSLRALLDKLLKCRFVVVQLGVYFSLRANCLWSIPPF